jgi:hypothetical protein
VAPWALAAQAQLGKALLAVPDKQLELLDCMVVVVAVQVLLV